MSNRYDFNPTTFPRIQVQIQESINLSIFIFGVQDKELIETITLVRKAFLNVRFLGDSVKK